MSLSTRVLVLSLLATILALHPNSLLSLIRLAPESAFTRPSLHHTTKRSAVDDVSNKGIKIFLRNINLGFCSHWLFLVALNFLAMNYLHFYVETGFEKLTVSTYLIHLLYSLLCFNHLQFALFMACKTVWIRWVLGFRSISIFMLMILNSDLLENARIVFFILHRNESS